MVKTTKRRFTKFIEGTNFFIWPGTETLADVTFLICPLRTLQIRIWNISKFNFLNILKNINKSCTIYCMWQSRNSHHHSIAWGIVLKVVGRDRRKLCIEARASMAVPSTTSMTVNPATFWSNGAAWTATAPPILWPTKIMESSGAALSITLATSLSIRELEKKRNLRLDVSFFSKMYYFSYSAKVPTSKSSSLVVWESPWPLKSIAITLQTTIVIIDFWKASKKLKYRLSMSAFTCRHKKAGLFFVIPWILPMLKLRTLRRGVKQAKDLPILWYRCEKCYHPV